MAHKLLPQAFLFREPRLRHKANTPENSFISEDCHLAFPDSEAKVIILDNLLGVETEDVLTVLGIFNQYMKCINEDHSKAHWNVSQC